MTYNDFREKTASALNSMTQVTAEPIVGHFYGCKFIKPYMIYLGKRDKAINDIFCYEFFAHEQGYDATHVIAKDEFFPISIIPQNDFGEYALLSCMAFMDEYPETLASLFDKKALDIHYRETDVELVLRCLLDTINLSRVLKGSDTEAAIRQVEAAVDKSCRERALNKHQYNRICYGILEKQLNSEHKQRVRTFMSQFIADFRSMQSEFQSRFDRTKNWIS